MSMHASAQQVGRPLARCASRPVTRAEGHSCRRPATCATRQSADAHAGAGAITPSRDYRARVSTTVLLRVTPKEAIEVDRYFGEVPTDVASALTIAGQSAKAGLSGRRGGLWRLQFQLSGLDRVQDAQQLQEQLRSLGYEVDVYISP